MRAVAGGVSAGAAGNPDGASAASASQAAAPNPPSAPPFACDLRRAGRMHEVLLFALVSAWQVMAIGFGGPCDCLRMTTALIARIRVAATSLARRRVSFVSLPIASLRVWCVVLLLTALPIASCGSDEPSWPQGERRLPRRSTRRRLFPSRRTARCCCEAESPAGCLTSSARAMLSRSCGRRSASSPPPPRAPCRRTPMARAAARRPTCCGWRATGSPRCTPSIANLRLRWMAASDVAADGGRWWQMVADGGGRPMMPSTVIGLRWSQRLPSGATDLRLGCRGSCSREAAGWRRLPASTPPPLPCRRSARRCMQASLHPSPAGALHGAACKRPSASAHSSRSPST